MDILHIKEPLISIAMTTYNGEKYILEQLESFSNQTRLPDELVITDDCSTDNTLEIIDNFKKLAPFEIRVYVNEKNLGYTQNFNKAMQLCTNDLIFLSDQDDVWFTNKIEYLVNLANVHQDKDLFMNDTELTDADLNRSGLTKLEQIKNAGFDENYMVMGCTFAVRKTFLDMILPIPKNFDGHDDWIVRLADFLDLRIIDKTVLQFYRRHGLNESQAIYNSLIKIRPQKMNVYEKIIVWIKFSKKDFFKKSIDTKTAFILGLERLSSHKRYSNKTEKLLNTMQNELSFLEQRLKIIETKSILSRFKQAFSFYKNSNYTLNNYVSDMIKS